MNKYAEQNDWACHCKCCGLPDKRGEEVFQQKSLGHRGYAQDFQIYESLAIQIVDDPSKFVSQAKQIVK